MKQINRTNPFWNAPAKVLSKNLLNHQCLNYCFYDYSIISHKDAHSRSKHRSVTANFQLNRFDSSQEREEEGVVGRRLEGARKNSSQYKLVITVKPRVQNVYTNALSVETVASFEIWSPCKRNLAIIPFFA